MYSADRKAMIVMQLLPPNNMSVAQISAREGISVQTLTYWKKQALAQLEQSSQKEFWSEAEKRDVVLATAKMDERSLYAFCDQQGLSRTQVRAWRLSYLQNQMKSSQERWVLARDGYSIHPPNSRSSSSPAWVAECEEG